MLMANRGLSWCLAAAAAFLAVGPLLADEPAAGQTADPARVAEWMSGVPRGCHLISFHLLGEKAVMLGRKDRVDIVWEYATQDRQQSATLLEDVGVLEAEQRGIGEGIRSVLRVTVALTPHQAHRLRVVAACSPLRIRKAVAAKAPRPESPPVWQVERVEDRTEAIEASLAGSQATREVLARPTLAGPQASVSTGFQGEIAVPVEVEE